MVTPGSAMPTIPVCNSGIGVVERDAAGFTRAVEGMNRHTERVVETVLPCLP